MAGGRAQWGAAGGISRRGLICAAAGAAGAAAAPGLPCAPSAPPPRVAFHADRLYLDRHGAGEAYIPPAGLRSLDGLSEDALRRLLYHP